MKARFDGPLEARPNRSAWAALFDLALPALDYALPDEVDRLARGDMPRWTLGGGTALALRLGHRISDDIDIFLSGVRLAELTPANNPLSKAIDAKPDWPGHFLKFRRSEGEIDFLGSALQTVPGFSVESFRGRSVALETLAEVMVKKINYRAAKFTARDAFDLACVLSAQPETALVLAAEVGDALPIAQLALTALSNEKVRAIVRADPAFTAVLENSIDRAQDGLERIAFLRDHPLPSHLRIKIEEDAATVDRFDPGPRPGSIHLTWSDPEHIFDEATTRIFREWHEAGRSALFNAWKRKDPDQFDRWDRDGRPPAPPRQRSVGRSGNDLDL